MSDGDIAMKRKRGRASFWSMLPTDHAGRIAAAKGWNTDIVFQFTGSRSRRLRPLTPTTMFMVKEYETKTS